MVAGLLPLFCIPEVSNLSFRHARTSSAARTREANVFFPSVRVYPSHSFSRKLVRSWKGLCLTCALCVGVDIFPIYCPCQVHMIVMGPWAFLYLGEGAVTRLILQSCPV
ncbi:hypothetical protein BS17DRAFT_459363 [Gyrodon lividus]|nr:hypothetical protein BS17DRAFT_459363 [Gyrodon lividus]